MPYIGNPIYQSAFVTDQFSGNGSTTAFTMSVAPAGVTNILVAVSGVLQDPSTYGVVGNTITFSAAPPTGTGNISCRYLGIPVTGVTTTAYRTVTEFTATASQTTFTPPSYTVGFINVYLNGVLLGSADYTATNGTTVVLATGASAGNLLTVESFLVSSVLNAIPNTAGSVSSSNIANDVTINFADGSASTPSITNNGDTNTGIFFPAADTIAFSEGGAEAMRIDSSGNVGIGTTSPTGKLDVSSSSAGVTAGDLVVDTANKTVYVGRQSSTSGDNSYLVVRGRANGSGTNQAIAITGDTTAYGTGLFRPNNDMLGFSTLATERMRIDSSGNLLVGTTSSITGGRSAFWSSTAAAAAEFRVNAGSSDATQAVTIIKNSTTNSTAQVLMNFTVNNGNTGAGQINCNGASAAAFGTFSDERLKENIESLPSQLQNICSLRPVEFNYIESEGGGHQIGFIAQEMQTVYPDAVGERQDGMLTVTGWSKTEARLVAAIQELKAELDATKAEVQALKGTL